MEPPTALPPTSGPAWTASPYATGSNPRSISGFRSDALLPDHVWKVPFVLAHVFEQLRVRHQLERDLHTPGTRVGLRVVEGELDLEPAKIQPAHPFGDLERVRVWVSAVVQPRSIVDADRFDDERVGIPAPNGVAEPRGVNVGRVPGKATEVAAIGVDLAPRDEDLVEHHRQLRRLNDLERVATDRHAFRHALGQTLARRPLEAVVLEPLAVDSCRMRLEGNASCDV